MEYPKRRHPRLEDYNYSTNGVYFITICTEQRKCILSDIVAVGRDDPGTPLYDIKLTEQGEIVNKYINSIPQNYINVVVDKYVIMPDHIHILISLSNKNEQPNGVPRSSRPTTTANISQIIGVLKRLINKEIGENIFQASFYDHIIRDENDYITKWNYIENNPAKWIEQKVGETNDKL